MFSFFPDTLQNISVKSAQHLQNNKISINLLFISRITITISNYLLFNQSVPLYSTQGLRRNSSLHHVITLSTEGYDSDVSHAALQKAPLRPLSIGYGTGVSLIQALFQTFVSLTIMIRWAFYTTPQRSEIQQGRWQEIIRVWPIMLVEGVSLISRSPRYVSVCIQELPYNKVISSFVLTRNRVPLFCLGPVNTCQKLFF